MIDPIQENDLEQCANLLSERFDAVLIIVCTKSGEDAGSTEMAVKAKGNYFACRGMAQEWIEMGRNQDVANRIGAEIREE